MHSATGLAIGTPELPVRPPKLERFSPIPATLAADQILLNDMSDFSCCKSLIPIILAVLFPALTQARRHGLGASPRLRGLTRKGSRPLGVYPDN
jgi:hypothetical protein